MDDVPATETTIKGLEETELRIRSLSTLLQFVSRQAGSEVRQGPDRRIVRLLDTVALLFVSGRHDSDVAAVFPTFDRASGLRVMVMATRNYSSGPGRDDTSIEAETATRGDLPSKPVVGTGDLSKALEADEVAFLVNHGYNTIYLNLHARHLEFLLNRTFLGSNEPNQENILRLEKYLHIYCARKLHRRLNIRWLGQRVKFLDLFNLKSQLRMNVMSRERVQQLPLAEIPAEFLEDVGLQWKKEDWLYDVLKQWGIDPQLESGNDPNLVLMGSSVFHLYYFVAAHLSNVHQSLEKLLPLLPGASNSATATEQRIEEARTTISSMANSLLIINRLTRSSRSFWRVMNTLVPLFFELLATGENPSATSSPESAPPSLHSQPSSEPIIPIDNSDRNRVKDEDTPANTKTEKLDNDLGFQDDQSLMQMLQRWFAMITQWTEIVHELEIFLPHVCRDKGKPLQIRAGYVPRPPHPTLQASFFDTIKDILPNMSLGDKLAAIKDEISENTSASECLNILRTVSEDQDPLRWQQAFEGGIHSGAQLAQEYGSCIHFRAIGTSERCCFCCNILLSDRGLNHATTHGKIYAWAPPLGLGHDIQLSILRRLEAQLEKFFRDAMNWGRIRDLAVTPREYLLRDSNISPPLI